MIDATRITQYDLFYNELEAYMIFWILAAGKNGTRAAKITNDMVAMWELLVGTVKPFKMLRMLSLDETIAKCAYYGTGCQQAKGRSLFEISRSGLDLRTCTAEALENIYGIGMKTARCFIIHSRKDAQYAGLDTHMLKHLASLGYEVPKSTPNRKLYLTIEKIVVKLAAERKMSPAAFDLAVWNSYKVVAKTTA